MAYASCATFQPLSNSLGAEVTNFDVKHYIKSGSAEKFHDELCEYQLLCFRNQELAACDLISLTKLLGPPLPHVLQQYSLSGSPEIYVLSNIVENEKPIGNPREGFGWHTDLAYMRKPAAYTILYGVEVPEVGADTLFASLYKMWDWMADDEKSYIRKLRGRYSYLKLYEQRENAEPLTEAQKQRTPDVTHPFARIHPKSGREGLYIGGDDFVAVEGSNKPEHDFDRIWSLFHDTTVRFHYNHKWQPNDLLIWDNRGLIHTATDYDTNNSRRLIWRTSVEGEEPIASKLT